MVSFAGGFRGGAKFSSKLAEFKILALVQMVDCPELVRVCPEFVRVCPELSGDVRGHVRGDVPGMSGEPQKSTGGPESMTRFVLFFLSELQQISLLLFLVPEQNGAVQAGAGENKSSRRAHRACRVAVRARVLAAVGHARFDYCGHPRQQLLAMTERWAKKYIQRFESQKPCFKNASRKETERKAGTILKTVADDTNSCLQQIF